MTTNRRLLAAFTLALVTGLGAGAQADAYLAVDNGVTPTHE